MPEEEDPLNLSCGCRFSPVNGEMIAMCEPAGRLRAEVAKTKKSNGPAMDAWLDHFKAHVPEVRRLFEKAQRERVQA